MFIDNSSNIVPTKMDYESKIRFRHHLNEKKENSMWLCKIFDHQSISPSQPFVSYPYRWDVKKSRVVIRKLTPITEFKINYGQLENRSEPVYVINIPLHNPEETKITEIIQKIEDSSFGYSASESFQKIGARVAVVIGLNNCESYDPDKARLFESKVERLRDVSRLYNLSRHVSLVITPFLWGHHWVPNIVSRSIHSHYKCYLLANSYFRHLNGEQHSLLISDLFNNDGAPLEKCIPYQEIRDTILHSTATNTFLKYHNSNYKYVLSLDGDFISLKNSNDSEGILGVYDKAIGNYLKNNGVLPDVISSGYEAPTSETNQFLQFGIKLDRSIRSSIPGKFVYMPEPNMAFRVDINTLNKLSWKGGTTMDTESRRLIAKGVNKGIWNSDRLIFISNGAVQTALDQDWRSNSVMKYQKFTQSDVYTSSFQKTLRAIKQSYTNPQIWATNVYEGLRIKIANYMQNAIAPIKAIRDLFDPIASLHNRFYVSQVNKKNLHELWGLYNDYVEVLEYHVWEDDIGIGVDNEFIYWTCDLDKEAWNIFLRKQLNILWAERDKLLKNYSQGQVDEIVQAAIATGQAIKEFI